MQRLLQSVAKAIARQARGLLERKAPVRESTRASRTLEALCAPRRRPRLLREYVYSRRPDHHQKEWRTSVPREALRNLHQLAHAAIFEETTWPANPARCDAIERMLINSGLLSEATRTYVDPRLIPEVEFLLFCIGTPDPDYILCFLVEYGHATEEEALEVTGARTKLEYHQRVRSLIFRAYKERFMRSISIH